MTAPTACLDASQVTINGLFWSGNINTFLEVNISFMASKEHCALGFHLKTNGNFVTGSTVLVNASRGAARVE